MLIKNLIAAGLFALSFDSGHSSLIQGGAPLPPALDEDKEARLLSFRERPPWLELQTGLLVSSARSQSLSRLPIALQLQLPMFEIPISEREGAGISGLLRAGLGWMERSARAACFDNEAELAERLLFSRLRPARNCRLAKPLDLYFEGAVGAKASIPHAGGRLFSSVALSAAAFHAFSGRWPRDTGYSGYLTIEPLHPAKSKIIPGIGAHALYYQNRLFFGLGFHLGVKFN